MQKREISGEKANVAVSKVLSSSDKANVSETKRTRSKSAPSTLADRVKSRVRIVSTGKTSGPGKQKSLPVAFRCTISNCHGVELYLADNPAYLKELAGLTDTSSDEEEEVQRKPIRSKSSSPVRFKRGKSYHDEGELKRAC